MSNNNDSCRTLNPLGFGLAFRQRGLDFNPSVFVAGGKELLFSDIVGYLVDELWFEPDYGYNLRSNLLRFRRGETTSTSIEVAIQNTLLRDDRLTACKASVQFNDATAIVNILVTVSGGETFEFIGNLNTLEGTDFTWFIS